jgi:YD repeat-containing protein
VNGRGFATRFGYDALGRLTQKGDERFIYEGKKLVAWIDAEGFETRYRYEGDAIVGEVRAGVEVVRKEEAPLRGFDGGNAVWEYDPCGRIRVLKEGSRVTSYSYFPTGELAQVVNPDGVKIYYERDDRGFVTGIHASDGSVHHELRRNRLGHVVWLDGVERIVDAWGRVLKEGAIENRYDERGRRLEMKILDRDCLVEYVYEGDLLREIRRGNLAGLVLYVHRFLEYDGDGNLLEEELLTGERVRYTYRNGKRVSVTSERFSCGEGKYQFDEKDQLVQEGDR